MSAPTLHPVTPTEPEILRAFSRIYESRGTGTYLDRIHCWAQRAKVTFVMWSVERGVDGLFYAVPEFPDVCGIEYRNCCGQGATQDIARQFATQHLQRYGIHLERVRWKFEQQNYPSTPVHWATPVVYDPPSFLQHEEVIGQGTSHKAATEDSAQKLLEHGYCRI